MDLVYQQTHHYRFSEPVAETPNSTVYKAQDIELRRNVALKKVLITGANPREKQKRLGLAQQELATMVQISDLTSGVPNIYGSHFVAEESALYIVMQWINGETLRQKVDGGILLRKSVGWMIKLCGILDAMSKKRMSHKDIKPENLMITDDGELYLLDFNLTISIPDLFSGTSGYKAPEMDFGSVTVDRSKVDMFAIGVMLYEFATGHFPVRGSDYEIYDLDRRKWDLFRLPHEIYPEIDRKLEETIVKLMAFYPENRYYSYGSLINDLRTIERRLANDSGRKR